MQTAVPAETAVFREKWKRTDSRFAAFGGRGELRSPLSPHRNDFSKHPGVLHGLFYDQAILWLDLQNAHAPGSLRSPSDAAPKCFFKTSRCSAWLILRFFAPPCTPLSRRPPDTGRTVSKAPLEGSWRAAPEGWVRHGDAQFRGIEERRFRLRLTGLHAFCRRQRLWNQSVWPSRTCRAKALMSEKAGQSRPAPPASPRSCTSEPAVMSK